MEKTNIDYTSCEEYIRANVRSLEIGDCYVSENVYSMRYGLVVVTRIHEDGRKALCAFILDRLCLGLKYSFARMFLDEGTYNLLVEHFKSIANLETARYETVHSFVWETVAFGETNGIEPHDSWKLTQYFLIDDKGAVEVEEKYMGRNGKRIIMAHSQAEANYYTPIVEAHVGKRGVKTVILGKNDSDSKAIKKLKEDLPDYWDEAKLKALRWSQPYTYKHPAYPERCNITNKELYLLIFTDPCQSIFLTDDAIDSVLSLDNDTLRQDLEKLILYHIGITTSNGIDDEYKFKGYSAIIPNCVSLLSEVGNSDSSLNAVLEVLRQQTDWLYELFGDSGEFLIVPTLVKLGKDNMKKLMDFMLEEGLNNIQKMYVLSAVLNIGDKYPEMHDEVHLWYDYLLKHIIKDYPNAAYTDSGMNADIISDISDVGMKDLWPYVEKLYNLDFIDVSNCGTLQDMQEDFEEKDHYIFPCYLEIHERYEKMEEYFNPKKNSVTSDE